VGVVGVVGFDGVVGVVGVVGFDGVVGVDGGVDRGVVDGSGRRAQSSPELTFESSKSTTSKSPGRIDARSVAPKTPFQESPSAR